MDKKNWTEIPIDVDIDLYRVFKAYSIWIA
jgi:hypothetical protein